MSNIIEIGHIVTTIGINTLALDDKELNNILEQHRNGIWGEVPEPIKTINNMNFKQQHGKIISRYPIQDKSTVVIVTTWDRSLTTVLLQEEYKK